MTDPDLTADPAILRTLADGAVPHARRFSWGATADGLLRSYDAALGARREAAAAPGLLRRRRRVGERART